MKEKNVKILEQLMAIIPSLIYSFLLVVEFKFIIKLMRV